MDAPRIRLAQSNRTQAGHGATFVMCTQPDASATMRKPTTTTKNVMSKPLHPGGRGAS
jgi:hypothetical protein